MNTKKVLIAVIVILALVGAWMFLRAPKPDYSAITTFEQCAAAGYPIMESYPEQCKTPDGRNFVRQITNDYSDLIKVDAPIANAAVSSPLVVTGQARGQWYFEASFPVRLEDNLGNILATAPAQAQGEWMTTEFVPFKVTLTFKQPLTKTGELVLKNDNPSGDPIRDKEVRIPITFSEGSEFSFGKPVTMAINDSVIFPDAGMLWLTNIEDSRCKLGVQCIWAGELTPVFSLGHASIEPVVKQTIRLGTVNNRSLTAGGYIFTLLSATETTATISVTIEP